MFDCEPLGTPTQFVNGMYVGTVRPESADIRRLVTPLDWFIER